VGSVSAGNRLKAFPSLHKPAGEGRKGRAAWGRSTNDISPFQTYTDAFDTERWLATGTLKGCWQHGAWLISPSASVGYVDERQEGYTDSLGVFIPGQTVSIGQAKFGPEISYRGAFVNGIAIEPFASLEGIWTFSEEGSDDLVVDTLAGNNELRGKVGAGVKAVTAGGTPLSISGSYDGLGDDDFQAVSGELRLAIPLQ
jgi:outer membrane autotransporter protein